MNKMLDENAENDRFKHTSARQHPMMQGVGRSNIDKHLQSTITNNRYYLYKGSNEKHLNNEKATFYPSLTHAQQQELCNEWLIEVTTLNCSKADGTATDQYVVKFVAMKDKPPYMNHFYSALVDKITVMKPQNQQQQNQQQSKSSLKPKEQQEAQEDQIKQQALLKSQQKMLQAKAKTDAPYELEGNIMSNYFSCYIVERDNQLNILGLLFECAPLQQQQQQDKQDQQVIVTEMRGVAYDAAGIIGFAHARVLKSVSK